MALFVSDRRLNVILGASIGLHAAIAIWALCGDPPAERAVMAATSGRVFVPDVADVEAQIVIDGANVSVPAAPVAPTPAPPPAPAPKPAAAPKPPTTAATPARHDRHDRLAEPSAKAIVDGLFADEHGLGDRGDVKRRVPGTDLQRQIDEAKRHGGTATIGGDDPRVRGDDRPRLGTAPDCNCDPDLAPPVHPAPRPDEPPPVIVVHPRPHEQPTTLTAAEVLRIITTQYMAGLERCQHELLRREGDVSGKVSLALTIGADGATAEVSAEGLDDGLDRCIEERAGAWRFPAPHDPTTGDATQAAYKISFAMQAK